MLYRKETSECNICEMKQEKNEITKDFARNYFIHELNGEAVCEPVQFDEYGDFVDCSKEFSQLKEKFFRPIVNG